MNLTRRELLSAGATVLAGTTLGLTRTHAQTSGPTVVAPPVGQNWPAQRDKFKRAWLDLLGEFPAEKLPLDPVIRKVAVENGVTRYHVTFRAETDDRVVAWLLVPERARRKPVPGIVCLHSTTFGTGKDSTIGLAGMRPGTPPEQWQEFYRNPEVGQAYGRDLAEHGYVTLSPDFATDGERIRPGERLMDTRPFYRRHPGWSMIGKNTWDIMRCVDFLQSLDYVDGKRIGCTGWSLGGHCTLFAAAFDERITAAVPNGGVLDWHLPSNAWARPDDMQNSPALIRRLGYNPKSGPYIYIKKFRPWVADPSRPLPVDFDSLLMMVAPRPLLILSSEWEFYSHKILPKIRRALPVYFDWRDSPGLPKVIAGRQQRRGYARTVDYYAHHNLIPEERLLRHLEALGAGDCLQWISFAGGHSLPATARLHMLGWFDRWLGFA
ncbi:MAG: acetylxylan esterase [Opitutaceae bacterium]|nr:acetylxylan esterase [Opitutaceae bacterium]